MDKEKNSYWQEVRGICIIAVVAIHILAEYQLRCKNIRLEWVLFRQLVNFAVPTFIFIAGYFTNISKVNDSIGRLLLEKGRATAYSIFAMKYLVLFTSRT